MPEKWHRCVESVKRQQSRSDRKKANPYAVCAKSTGQSGGKGHGKKKG